MAHYYLFVITSLVSVAIPGPDFLLVFQTSIRKGRREGVFSAIGIACGLCVHGLAATIGLSALLLKSAQAFEIVKWAGAIYLVYLAGKLIIDLVKSKSLEPEPLSHFEQEVLNHVPAHKYVLRGFLTNVLNIKAALFFVAIVPQFVVGTTNLTLQIAILSVIQVLMALVWFSFLAVAVNKLGVFLKKRVVQRWLDGATAAIFLALAAKLASTKRA